MPVSLRVCCERSYISRNVFGMGAWVCVRMSNVHSMERRKQVFGLVMYCILLKTT